MRNRVLTQWLGGTLGGVLAWILTEPVPWLTTDPAPGAPPRPVELTQTIVFGLMIGLAVGAVLAASYGSTSTARSSRYLVAGAFFGAIGGALGMGVGQFLYGGLSVMFASMADNAIMKPIGVFGMVIARTLGWACIGLGLGLMQGAVNESLARSRNGAIGGLIGGAIGGFAFEILESLASGTADAAGRTPMFFISGELLRFLALTVTGSAIGLFVGLAERILRNAWVRVLVGRNEGMEYVLDGARNIIGRDEMADIPLFGDIDIAKQHAEIFSAGGAWAVRAMAPGVSVNGIPAQQAPLADGDVITIAKRQIEFHQKGAPRAARTPQTPPQPLPRVNVPEGVCEFCGQRKDASGGCACSPSSAPPAPAPATSMGLRLVCLTGPYAGHSFPVGSPLVVGRDPAHDLPLSEDSMVSRRHARLAPSGDGLEVSDEGSSNGTWLNGSRITRAVARPGDEITFGQSRFRLEAA